MTDRPTVALIVAAGTGSRMGGDLPKQFAPIEGRAMLAHSYRALHGHSAIDHVLVVIGTGQEAMLDAALGPVPHVIGGATRRASVHNGLKALAADPPARVLIHDAARPFVPARVIDDLLAALDTYDGAIPVLPIADTLVRFDGVMGNTMPRDDLFRVQTPQAFRFETVMDAHDRWPADCEATDDAQMVRDAGYSVTIVRGDAMLEKMTYPEDIAPKPQPPLVSRTATGFDVHRLVAGEQLWLGGVLVPHDKGLSGHSDADVALHAITDALLGTIAAGDIGTYFPPTDPRWRGADSAQFLTHAAGLVTARGGMIDFIDLTILCEAPKIGPHREKMCARIADLLGLDVGQVSVKATTTERLGFTGRGEGIAAQAAATVRLP